MLSSRDPPVPQHRRRPKHPSAGNWPSRRLTDYPHRLFAALNIAITDHDLRAFAGKCDAPSRGRFLNLRRSPVRPCRQILSRACFQDIVWRVVSAGSESPVDNQAMPGDERRPARTQPQHGFANFLDPADATDGMQRSKIFLVHTHARGQPVDHLRVDHRGADRINANPLRGKFQSGGFR